MLIAAALLFALVLRVLYLHLQVAHAELIRRDTKGPLSYEGRQRTRYPPRSDSRKRCETNRES